MERIEQYTAAIKEAAEKYFRGKAKAGILQLCGVTGMGKSTVARHYVKNHGGLHFSFRHLEATVAPKVFLPGCLSWEDFFERTLKTKNRPVIFFDDTDDRGDKDIFFSKISLAQGKAFVVLLCREEMKLELPSTTIHMKTITFPELCKKYKKLDKLDALRLIAMTDGNPGLMAGYQFDKSFAENMQAFFTEGSAYLRHAPEEMARHFRSPESYNTLLYGMVTGHNRIVQLSDFSGYPKNKCGKYLKALDAVGLLESAQRKDDGGHLRTHYYPKDGYLKIWYAIYFPNQTRFAEPLSEEVLTKLVDTIDAVSTKPYFRKICWKWMDHFARHYYWDSRITLSNPEQRNVTRNGFPFDFVQIDKDRCMYMKIWEDTKVGFPKDVFQRVEKASTGLRPFFNNFYFLFTIRRVANYIENLQSLDNMIVVDLDALSSKKCEELFAVIDTKPNK